jgi:hypothetical protein
MPMPRKTDQELEALKTLVVMFGPREAARQCKLNEDTVCGLAWRRGWRKASAEPIAAQRMPVESPQSDSRLRTPAQLADTHSASPVPETAASATASPSTEPKASQKQSPSTAVKQALTALKHKSMVGLATYSARAATIAAEHPKPLEISRKVKDVSDVHKALWSNESSASSILQIGILIGENPLEGKEPLKGADSI